MAAPPRPMSVLLAGHCRSAISLPFAGGLEAITWHLARGLVERGHRVTLFGARGSDCGPQVQVVTPEDLGVHVDPVAPWDDTRADVNRAFERLAEKHGATRLVIGLRRRSAVGKLVLGSVSQRILLDATVPVLAVHV